MPKYEDFKFGDVWICRDGSEAVITSADNPIHQEYTVTTSRGSITSEGFYRSDKVPHPRDLIRPKTPALDLTKPLRFKGAIDTFSASEIENAPEPVGRTLKQWVVVHRRTGTAHGGWRAQEDAERNCSPGYIVVEMTGEYHV